MPKGVYAKLKMCLNLMFLVGAMLVVSCSGGAGGIKTYTPDGLANCYMVIPGGSVSIPITRAITLGGMDKSSAATVETLWDDNAVISSSPTLAGSGASRTITVQTSSAQGNAVIAIKGANTGTIYWSWHIWVVNYDPNKDGTWTNPNNPNYTFMDRNLGATDNQLNVESVGLTYQWGRKDPFPSGCPGAAGYTALSLFKGEDQVTNISETERGGVPWVYWNQFENLQQNSDRYHWGTGSRRHATHGKRRRGESANMIRVRKDGKCQHCIKAT
jgi:hypothetical protein